MLARILLVVLLISAFCLGTASLAAAEPTTVALTLLRPEAQAARDLGENLLSLVELAMQFDKNLAIVERRQINLLVQEQILDRSRPGDPQLQLGKLLTADLVVMLETLRADANSSKPWARLRVVGAQTAAIRGVTVAPLDEATLEETAGEFAAYVAAVIRRPDKPVVTVAVAPFESQGRFDRLRPLELGIRDLVTARLLELSGATGPAPASAEQPAASEPSTPGASEPSKPAEAAAIPGQPLRFQVLQRSNLEQLLRELDLIDSGFADQSRLPETPASRAAAYLIRGEIDERQADEKFTIVVRGELVSAASGRAIDRFEFAALPADLEKQLAHEVDRFGQRLWQDEKIVQPASVAGTLEVASLEQQTLNDLQRFYRMNPLPRDIPSFRLPGQPRRYPGPRSVAADSALGGHLLRKSIDRLESILLIHPDDALAAYALGYCYTFHQPGIYRADRADELLRKAYALDPDDHLAGLALGVLAHIAYDERTGELTKGAETETIGRLWFAFEHTPVKHRENPWFWYLSLLSELHKDPSRNAALAELLEKTAPYAEEPSTFGRDQVERWVQWMAMHLVRQAKDQPELKAKGLALLNRWAEGDDPQLANVGRLGLAELLSKSNDHLAAAKAYEAAAAKIVDLGDRKQREKHDEQLIEAAKSYRQAGDLQRALELLLSFEVPLPPADAQNAGPNLVGKQLYEIGVTYEALGDKENALAAYVRATEKNPTVVAGQGDCWDILRRIEALGGVPLRPDRDVVVRYFPNRLVPFVPWRGEQGPRPDALASDGHKLFVGNSEGLCAFDIASETWAANKLRTWFVTCLKVHRGQVWVGTDDQGLWCYDPASGNWRRVGEQELPDRRIESLAVMGEDLYLGVGSRAAGGLARIDRDEHFQVFDEPDSPRVAPTRIVGTDKAVLACTKEAVFERSLADHTWIRHEMDWRFIGLFAGPSGIWKSGLGRELSRWGDTPEEAERYKAAWYLPEHNSGYVVNFTKAGYPVLFVTERGDEVWFGGGAYLPYVNSGLYRFNRRTGVFHKFGPPDGFKAPRETNTFYDGLWIDNRLWLVGRQGLCAVTPLDGAPSPPSAADPATPP